MSSSHDVEMENVTSYSQHSLDKLPAEILLLIFSNLDAYFLSRTVTRVCVRFSRLLHDEFFWKKRLSYYLQKHLGCNEVEVKNPYNAGLDEVRWKSGYEVLWRDLAVSFNLMNVRWDANKSKIHTQIFSQPHFAPVDTVKIIGNGRNVVSGGRDRMVNMWTINPETLALEGIHSAERCHAGWIWDIDSFESESFFTCSWDTNVYHWSSEGLLRICTYNCDKPVMAISSTRGLVAAGLHIPRIILIDPRIGLVQDLNPAAYSCSFTLHSHTVTDVLLLAERNLLLSISEDRTLSFFDIRFHKQSYKTITITRDNSFPKCLGFHRELVYIGDSRGNVHIHNLGTDVLHNQTFNIGTNRLVTSVVPHLGGALIGSVDRHVRMIYSSNPPVVLWDQIFPGEVTSVDRHKNVVAVSSAVGTVNLYKCLNL